MHITMQGRVFWLKVTDEQLTLSYLNDKEYLLIQGSSAKWATKELYDRLEQYSNIPHHELIKLAKERY